MGLLMDLFLRQRRFVVPTPPTTTAVATATSFLTPPPANTQRLAVLPQMVSGRPWSGSRWSIHTSSTTTTTTSRPFLGSSLGSLRPQQEGGARSTTTITATRTTITTTTPTRRFFSFMAPPVVHPQVPYPLYPALPQHHSYPSSTTIAQPYPFDYHQQQYLYQQQYHHQPPPPANADDGSTAVFAAGFLVVAAGLPSLFLWKDYQRKTKNLPSFHKGNKKMTCKWVTVTNPPRV